MEAILPVRREFHQESIFSLPERRYQATQLCLGCRCKVSKVFQWMIYFQESVPPRSALLSL